MRKDPVGFLSYSNLASTDTAVQFAVGGLLRGGVGAKGRDLRMQRVVEPAVPAFMGTLSKTGSAVRATRLDLADWLVTPESDGGSAGLTARVFVNRIWGLLFGEALCPSVEDFGGQGRPPTNLPLLDKQK